MKRNTISLLLVTVLMLTLVSSTAFALPDDSILSQNIKEADGTSGQDTNNGSGIKTGHIQDSAVTTSKIADGAITPGKIGFYSNVIIVATSGGDYASPVEAMNSITDASESNPYLVKIMPGVYNIGSNSVQMKPYVDIEGSGENTTKIIGNMDSSISGVVVGASNSEIRFLTLKNEGGSGNAIGMYISGTSPQITNITAIVTGVNNTNRGIDIRNSLSRLTNVTITTENAYNNHGIYNEFSSLAMTNVIVNVTGGNNDYGILNYSAAPVMNNVLVNVNPSVFGYGIHIEGNIGPVMRNVVINAPIGIFAIATGIINIDNSIITGTSYSLRNATGTTTYVGNTKLDGTIFNAGVLKCIGVYNGTYDPITCQ